MCCKQNALTMAIFLAALIFLVQGSTAARKTWDFVLIFFQVEKVVSGMQFVCVCASQPAGLSLCTRQALKQLCGLSSHKC
jgi:hypothetical protein